MALDDIIGEVNDFREKLLKTEREWNAYLKKTQEILAWAENELRALRFTPTNQPVNPKTEGGGTTA